MEPFKPSEALRLSGNLKEIVSGKIKEEEKIQCALLLHLIGEDVLEIYNNFSFATGESREKSATMKQKFYDYFNPQKNTIYKGCKFWETKQKEGETVDQFIRLENTCQILRVR